MRLLVTGANRGIGAALAAAAEVVARGILDLAERLTPAENCRFFRFSGEQRAF